MLGARAGSFFLDAIAKDLAKRDGSNAGEDVTAEDSCE